MKRTYQDVVNRIKEVANAHSGIYSVDTAGTWNSMSRKSTNGPGSSLKPWRPRSLAAPGRLNWGGLCVPVNGTGGTLTVRTLSK
jgi:hypothetical protein